MKRHYFFLAASLLLISCGSKQAENTDAETAPIGGSDAAMGYTYSKVLDKKIRIFEDGMRMLSAIDPQATTAAFAVFPSDSSKVELFMPEETVVLEKRVRPDGTAVWNVEDDDTYMFERCADEWLVSRRGKVLYASTGSIFFTTAGLAQIRYDGVDYLLRQYVTASGYGYKNPFVDIRGKGQDMTLTFSAEGKSIAFTEKK